MNAAGWARAALVVSFGLTLALVYLSRMSQGLWEDGYFVKRFAYNFWQHGAFSWNASDGPVYGMTSQTLQLLAASLYALAPRHLVLSLKAASVLALFSTLIVLWHSSIRENPSRAAPSASVSLGGHAGLLPCAVGLSISLLLEAALTGLETALALFVIALSLAATRKPAAGPREVAMMIASVLAVYLTRPDAVLIPLALLGARWLFAVLPIAGSSSPGESAGERAEARAIVYALIGIGAGLSALLLLFQTYYGTALPLPFYIKTQGITVHPDHYVAIFAREKSKNVVQALFFALPFIYIALHARSRTVVFLLAAGGIFFAYHYFATIETMGHLSRFYLPGMVPIISSGAVAYARYLERRRWAVSALCYAAYVALFGFLKRLDEAERIPILLDGNLDLPVLCAVGLLLLVPPRRSALGAVAIGLCLVSGAALNYPLRDLELADDESILLRQIRPRVVFRGLEQLRHTLQPKTIFHTDMGAPGVLFPESKVVDLDGLLNEDIALRGMRFEQLCQRDRPEAIFVPNTGYRELRREVLSSECLRGYRAVVPMSGSPLHIREDLLARYSGGH